MTFKEMVRKTSPLLYNLTKKRAFFQQVTIVVPNTWSNQPEYKMVTNEDYFSTANLRIAPPNPSYNNTPYTFQPGGCGELGRYIHMTPDFILNFPDDGIPGGDVANNANCSNCDELAKIFVHEWLHLRYGVFDEHGITESAQFPMFYLRYEDWVS